MSSTEYTLAGICRKTATAPFRSLAALQRKRANPWISYAQSVSQFALYSMRFRSGMIDFSIPESVLSSSTG